jgi:hypothetical protein
MKPISADLSIHVVFGGLAIMVTLRDGRPVGFASPAFTGFALIER